MLRALTRHWPEYVMEAAGLGLTVIVACSFAVLLFHPHSLVVRAVESMDVRRGLMGLAMGATGIAIVYSPWGKQSGAHFNPAVTLTFFRLRRVPAVDAVWYAVFQLLGAFSAIGMMALLIGERLADPAIHYVSASPGSWGAGAAWIAECAMTFLLMTVVLFASNSRRLGHWTGVFVGLLVAANVSLMVPLLGTSLNPARALSSAVPARAWMSLWIYWTAAPVGMLFAAEHYVRRYGAAAVFCAKLHHQNATRCIFCDARAEQAARANATAACNRMLAAASNETTLTSTSHSLATYQEPRACPPSATTT